VFTASGTAGDINMANGLPLTFKTASTERMRIDSNGVGIGTTSPVTLLNTKGATLTTTTDKREILIEAHGDGINNSQGALTGITFRNSPTTYTAGSFNRTSGVYGLNEDSAGYGRSMGLAFYTATNDATAAERMRIGSSGTLKSTVNGAVANLLLENDADTPYMAFTESGSAQFFIGESSIVGGGGGYDIYAASGQGISFFTNALRRVDIDTSGNLLVGTTSALASTKFSLVSSGNGFAVQVGNGSVGSYMTNTSSTANWQPFSFNNNGTSFSQIGSITCTASATAYNTSSDYRLKENVVAMTGATERLKQLNPSRFNFIADADVTVDGFLAHEVQAVVPEAITGTKDAVDDDGNAVYQGIDQSKLVPLLVATIQELEARITQLENN
jgi:hypothetical protein